MLIVTGYDVTGSCITGNDVTGNEREIISRAFFTRISLVFVPVFPASFPELL
jgi:hypothetical protein